jgi:tRNA (guanine37-N1)-methyltransferase
MNIGVVSLFPEMFNALHHGIPGRAIEYGLLNLTLYNPRDFTEDKHRTVDNRPYGGGPGMVLMYQPMRDAIRAAKRQHGNTTPVIYLSPQGKPLHHHAILSLAQYDDLVFVAGRYEGIDERLRETEITEEWSLGDYVISGGEFAAMIMIDAIMRQVPGALGHTDSAKQDSFAQGLLDHPHYTRPEKIDGMCVPEVLLSGNHAAIETWRQQEALKRTWLRRPDLLNKVTLSKQQKLLLEQFKKAYGVDE